MNLENPQNGHNYFQDKVLTAFTSDGKVAED